MSATSETGQKRGSTHCAFEVRSAPTRYGAPAAQMKQFLDGTGPVWFEGKLANKPGAVFTGAQNAHGGHENTIHAMYNVFMHWGAIVVPPAEALVVRGRA